MFAYPPEPGVARERLLEHGARVDEHPKAHGTDALDDVLGQSLQGVAQYLVIVPAERVPRHVALLRVGQRLDRVACIGRPVVHARRQHAHGAGHQLVGPRAARAVSGHVAHLAVFAMNQPTIEMRGIGLEPEVADAERIEPALAGERSQVVPQFDQGVGRSHGALPV